VQIGTELPVGGALGGAGVALSYRKLRLEAIRLNHCILPCIAKSIGGGLSTPLGFNPSSVSVDQRPPDAAKANDSEHKLKDGDVNGVLISVSRPDIRLEALAGVAIAVMAIGIGALLACLSPNPYRPNIETQDNDKRRRKSDQDTLG
jgi:hypothetical protein